MVRKQEGKRSRKITKIDNDYVHSLQQKKDRRKAQKKGLYRRLAVFAVIVVIAFSVLTHTFIGQKKLLAVKEQEKQDLIIELAEKEEEQAMLASQLEKLNDDEYIAKLARQEYFLSDKNEIIFSLPKKDQKGKKKNEEKE